ncbi:MAG: hypothetical protein AB7S97_00825 [Thermoplasmata archaeon]
MAVGGFFEDLPVLAFVLAGVLSVAGTASWASGMLSEDEWCEELERSASQLVAAVVAELRGVDILPTVEAVRQADVSSLMRALPEGTHGLVSVWSVHPVTERLLMVGSCEGEPLLARSESMLMNAVFDGGAVGILEVRVLVWDA